MYKTLQGYLKHVDEFKLNNSSAEVLYFKARIDMLNKILYHQHCIECDRTFGEIQPDSDKPLLIKTTAYCFNKRTDCFSSLFCSMCNYCLFPYYVFRVTLKTRLEYKNTLNFD